MSVETDSFYDPNAHVAPELRQQACCFSLPFFRQARMVAYQVDTGVPNSFMLCQSGTRRHLVYVRVTQEDEPEDGTGPLPGILIDQAREMEAEPHVVRVHFRTVQGGTAMSYFGHEALTRTLQEGDPWRRLLIGKRTARDYLALAQGRLSRLELELECSPPGKPPPRIVTPVEKQLQEVFQEVDNPDAFPGQVLLKLRIDTLLQEHADHIICLHQLTQSAITSGEYFIFTCTCGVPECTGIWRGIEVVHEFGLVVWRIRGVRPRRIVVFDRSAYRSEILAKVRQALELFKPMGEAASLGASDRPHLIEELLYRATEDGNG